MTREILMPSFSLTGKTAVVTGGTKGLGFGIAATYARHGASVIITARTAADVEASVAEINKKYTTGENRCIGVTADSARQADIDKVISSAVKEFGKLDILVNNSGISGKTANIFTDECDEENFANVIAINLNGVFLFAQRPVLPCRFFWDLSMRGRFSLLRWRSISVGTEARPR